MTKTFKIVRGTYLTGLGQEPSAYYFKVSESDADFETIAPGDVALTFYQNGETITSFNFLSQLKIKISNKRQSMQCLVKSLH